MSDDTEMVLHRVRATVIDRIEKCRESIREHEALLNLIDKYPDSATVVEAMRKLGLV